LVYLAHAGTLRFPGSERIAIAGSPSGKALATGSTVRVPDVLHSDEFPEMSQFAPQFRTFITAPLIHNGVGVGTIVMYGSTPSAFTDKQIELLETFADQ